MTNRTGSNYKLGDGPRRFFKFDTSSLLPALWVGKVRIPILAAVIVYILLTGVTIGVGAVVATVTGSPILLGVGVGLAGLGFLAFFVGVLSFIIVIFARVFKDFR